MATRIAVIGAGASGMVAAEALSAQEDLEITVFERGGEFAPDAVAFGIGEGRRPKDSLRWEAAPFLQPSVKDEPRLVRYTHDCGPFEETDAGWPGVGVGGGTLRWAGASWRYPSEDFDLPTLYQGLVENIDDFHPWPQEAGAEVFHGDYYAKAEAVMGIAGEGSSTDAVRAQQYPRPPLWETGVMRRFKSAATSISGDASTTCTVPLAIQTDGKCNLGTQCAPCMWYVCPFDEDVKFNTGAKTFIERVRAAGVTLKTGCVTTRINHKDGRVTGIDYLETNGDGNPQSRSEDFDLVILACAALESARLFLLSAIPDPEKLIGHYLTFHVHPTSLGFFDEQVKAHYKYHQAATTAYTRLRHQGRTIMGGLVDLNATYSPHSFLGHGHLLAQAFGTRTWGKDFFDNAKHYFTRHVSLGGTAEDLPSYRNRIELDPDRKDVFGRFLIRIFHHDHPLNQRVFDRLAAVQRSVLEAMGAKVTVSTGLRTGADHHQHGTLRMSADRKTGVLDPFCQSWEVKGIYVVDGSPFPNSGSVNPTLTIVANALRVCDAIGSTL